MIACDWCSKKKEGKWGVVIQDKTDTSYGGKTVVDVVLCDAHYEPIRKACVEGEET